MAASFIFARRSIVQFYIGIFVIILSKLKMAQIILII